MLYYVIVSYELSIVRCDGMNIGAYIAYELYYCSSDTCNRLLQHKLYAILLHIIVQSAILILVTGNSIIYQKSFFHKKFSGKNKTSAKLLCWGFQQRYKDSNLEMTESESVALPFGDSAQPINAL